MSVSSWSTTASSNTTIDGTNIAENCSPAGINNAIRSVMAAVRGFYDSMFTGSGVRFLRINADNTTTARTAAELRGDLGAAASGANTDITSLAASTTPSGAGTIASDALGFRGLPQNSQTGAYALVLADQGRHISITTGGVSIPANGVVAFPVGATVVIYNNSGSTQSITITTDTLRLAGTATTGTRTLAARGFCTLVKVAATEWVATGNVT